MALKSVETSNPVQSFFESRRGSRALIFTEGALPFYRLIVDRFEQVDVHSVSHPSQPLSKNTFLVSQDDLIAREAFYDWILLVGTVSSSELIVQLSEFSNLLAEGGWIGLIRQLRQSVNRRQENYLRYRQLVDARKNTRSPMTPEIEQVLLQVSFVHPRVLSSSKSTEKNANEYVDLLREKLANNSSDANELNLLILDIQRYGIEPTGQELIYAKKRGSYSESISSKSRPAQLSGTTVAELIEELRSRSHEHIVAVFLSEKDSVIQSELISTGTVDAATIPFANVIRPAVATGASQILLMHNHPSGSTTPSMEDKIVTRELHAICRMLGIRLKDHLIIGATDVSSALK